MGELKFKVYLFAFKIIYDNILKACIGIGIYYTKKALFSLFHGNSFFHWKFSIQLTYVLENILENGQGEN